MTAATFRAPSFPTQDPATYKANIDAGFKVSQRYLDQFAPHAQSTPNMTVALDAGFTFYGGSLTEVAAQNTAVIAASSRAGITRIDRVVADIQTGAASVVAGTSIAPALPAGKQPVAQVALTTGSTAITNAMLTDERALPAGRAVDYQVFTSTAFTWNKPIGFTSDSQVVVMQWSGGGGGSTSNPGSGGGGCACIVSIYSLGQLSTAVSGSVALGGAAGAIGGNTVFNGVTVYGGNSGVTVGGGGAGIYGFSTVSGNNGGAPGGGAPGGAGASGSDSAFGGAGGGGNNNGPGGRSVYGGGGGGGSNGGAGGPSLYGGGGGAGNGGARGVSVFGGNGGSTGFAAAIPGGGGAQGQVGARGEVRIWVLP